ncbi:hypothetical protein [Paenibacillus sedimenti]|uniref:Uncharacterized protein n=1 Tax=Paenibacillus sedimenti TaxID=2770274 RepID=A0A926QLG6_9BACL|nr:hypothetical protein [Paenibacillus sedimenti]MBD0382404.1 hypothetical protein [Paenibacillus sedimenti]
MKTIGKKILTSTMIASFVLGVGFVGALHNDAFAASDSASVSSSTAVQKADGKGRGGFGDRGGRFLGGNVIKETATILGVEQSAVEEALKAGKSLAAFAEEKGLAKADYLQKLIAAETTAINAQVTAGKITQEQADKAIAGLSDQLTKQIEHAGFGGKGGFHGGGKGFGGGKLAEHAAAALGVEQSAVEEALKAGKTLSAFAQEKGVSEADLVQKLVAAQTTAINAEVTAGKLTQEQADKMLSGLSDRVTKQVQSTGPVGGFDGGRRGGHGGPGGMRFGNPEVLTTILGITQDELRTQLQEGKSIAEIAAAKGISEDELINKIKDGMTDSIKKFVESKHTRPAGGAPADAAAPAVN